jgi:hypothetical protein
MPPNKLHIQVNAMQYSEYTATVSLNDINQIICVNGDTMFCVR